MPKILISACLLGHKVRYDGKDNLQNNTELQVWIKAGKVVTICPEMAGGLPTPRPPAEIQYNKSAKEVLSGKAKIITIDGDDVSAEYMAGAQKALALAKQHHISVAILKARSPSCGSQQVYDGRHSKKLVDGMGVTAALLSQHGIQVFDETEIDQALEAASKFKLHSIDHLVLRTNKKQEMLEFYCNVLGCSVETWHASGTLIPLRAGDNIIDLAIIDHTLNPAEKNLEHFCLRIQPFDYETLQQYFAKRNIEIVRYGSRYGSRGFYPSFYIQDPEGNEVELTGKQS